MASQTPPSSPPADGEIVIDLAKYAHILVAGWRWLAAGALAGGLLGLGASYVFPAPYEAVAGVAMVKSRTEVEFDSRIKTTGPDGSAQTASSAEGRRTALVGLVTNGKIATDLAAKFASRLDPQDRSPGALLRKITADAGTGNRSELISIRVRDVDAQLATDIANAWAEEYEKLANGIYGGANGDNLKAIDSEFSRSQKELDIAQRDLESFIAKNSIEQLTRQISESVSALSTLQRDRQSAVFDARFNAVNDAQIALVREQANAETLILRNLYDARVRSASMRDEAMVMRSQVRAGGDAAATSNALALLSLKARAYGTSLPQLQLGQLPVTNAEAQLADLNALVSALDARLNDLAIQISDQSKRINEGAGLATLSTVATTALNLPVAAASPANDALISQLQSAVAQAQAKIEAQKAEQLRLTQARDLARSTYETLAKKRAEVEIASVVTGSEVRLGSPAVVPAVKTQGRSVYGAGGIVFGVLIGLFLMIARHFSRPQGAS